MMEIFINTFLYSYSKVMFNMLSVTFYKFYHSLNFLLTALFITRFDNIVFLTLLRKKCNITITVF